MTDKPYTRADVALVARAMAPEYPGAADDFTYCEDAARVLDALAAAGRLAPTTPGRHVIAFADDGTWSLEHPAACPNFTCQVRLLAEQQVDRVTAPALRGGRYECSINGLCDRFLLGDRIDQPDPDIWVTTENINQATKG